MVLRRVLLLLLLVPIGCSDTSGGACPDGSVRASDVCRRQCSTVDDCLLSEVCDEQVCRPAPDDLVEIRRFELSPTRVDVSVPIEVRYAVLGAPFSELFVVRGSDEVRVARFVEPVGTYSFVDTTASGTLVLRAEVEEASVPFAVDLVPRPVRIDSFEANANIVAPGDQVALDWTTTGASRVRITANGSEIFDDAVPDGEFETVISESTVFELTAIDQEAFDTASLTVTVDTDEELRIGSFVVTPAQVVRGDSVALQWSVTGARRIDVEADGRVIYSTLHPATVQNGAWLAVPIADETSYRLVATSLDGNTVTESEELVVASMRRPAPPRLSGVFVDPPYLEGEITRATIFWDALLPGTRVTVIDRRSGSIVTANGNQHDVEVTSSDGIAARFVVHAENEGGADDAVVTLFHRLSEREPNDVLDVASGLDVSDAALFGSIDPSLVDVDRFVLNQPAAGFIRVTQRAPCQVGIQIELRRAQSLIDTDTSTPQRCASLLVASAAPGPYSLSVSDALTGGQDPARPYELWVETVGAPICGNDQVEPTEGCDDGNRANFDGCSGTCQVEPTHQYAATQMALPSLPNGDALDLQSVASTGDDGYAVVPLPFSFPMFGSRYAAMVVHTNGYVGFLPDFVAPDALLSSPFGEAPPNAVLAPFAADLNLAPASTSSIRVATIGAEPDLGFLVMFRDLRFDNGTTSLTGGVGLFAGGRFALFYGPLVTPMGRGVQAGAEDVRGKNRVVVPGCGEGCTTSELPSNTMFEFKPGGPN